MKTRIPSLRLHRPSGRAVVTLSGKDHYCGPYGSPAAQQEYQRLLGEWLASGGTPPAAARSGISVAEMLVPYLKFTDDYYRPPSQEAGKIRRALRPVAKRYGHTPAKDFGPLALKAVREIWIAERLARKHINQLSGRIVRAWRWAAENEMVPADAWHALKAVSGLRAGRTAAREGRVVRPVADAVVEATIAEIKAPQVVAILRLLRLTGARAGEICSMRTADVDRSTTPWTFTPRHHKTAHHGHDRAIYLGPKAREILEPWLRDDPEAIVFSPREAVAAIREAGKAAHRSDADRARNARNQRNATARRRGGKARRKREPGEQYDASALGHAIKRACERAGVDRWHTHQLRHTAATELRRSADLETARVVLGHRSPGITAVYAEADRTAAAAAMEQLG